MIYSAIKNQQWRPGLPAGLSLLWPIVRRYRWRLAGGLLCLTAVDALQLLVPRLLRRGIDGLASHAIDGQQLGRLAVLIAGLAVATAVCRFGWRYLVVGFSRILERDVRQRLFDHLLRLDRPFFQQHSVGELMALATNDLAAVQLACGMGLVAAADALLMILATLGFMCWINVRLTMIAILPLPALALAALVLLRHIHNRFRVTQERFGQITEFVRSSLHAIRLVQAYTQEQRQHGHLEQLGQQYVRDNLLLARAQGILYPFAGLAANACLLLVVLFGGRMVIHGQITIGDFTAFLSYLFLLVWPMMAVGWVANIFQRGLTSLKRLHEILQHQPLLTNRARPSPALARANGPPTLGLQGLRFRYPGSDRPALQDCSVTFPPGVTGVVGPTGSGKSTLCQILVRLWPAPPGTFFIDGVDVATLSLSSFRDLIAYVPQEGTLFAGTVADNIRLGRPEAGQEAVEEAARMAAIHEEIMALPNGYATQIGERGVRLSGGQRQRLALARALLLDRPVFVMDDGLSAVDAETEATIMATLAAWCDKRTAIIVSHRLAALRCASRLVVLADGRVRAMGGLAELAASNDYVRAVLSLQAKGN